MRFRKATVALVATGALTALAAGCGSSNGSGGSAAPAQLTVWRMGATTPSQVTWMNGVIKQFHAKYPAYAKTKIIVKFVPWANRTTAWSTALQSGKNAPDVTELGNTDTPTEAGQHVLSNIAGMVHNWSASPGIVPGMLANDTAGSDVWALPWFGGVRGVWYRTDWFKKAGISSPPTTWAQLVADAKLLQKRFPGTWGFGAPSDYSNGIASFIWGAGGEIAVLEGKKWVAQLNTPTSEAGIKFYAGLTTKYHVSPPKYVGDTELGTPGATSGGSNEDFALGKLDMYLDGPWATAEFPKNAVDTKHFASFPLPARLGGGPAPVFAGGSDLGIFATSKYPTADFDLIKVMDSPANSTSFASAQGFFPPFTAQIGSGVYTGSKLMAGFASAAKVTKIAPLNAPNWAIADTKDAIIPTMMKAIEQGAPFAATVNKYNTEIQNVLNSGHT